MSDEIYSKGWGGDARLESLARKCRLEREDEERALSVYQGMIDAIADRVAGRGREAAAPPPVVYLAAYQHRYGVDLSAHGSRDHAESRLLSIAWQQCMRDADIRAAVDARFGPLVSEEPPLEHPFEADLHDDRIGAGEAVVDWIDGNDDGEARRFTSPLDADGPMALAARDGVFAGMDADNGCSSRESREDRRERTRRTFCEKLLEEWPEFARGEALWIVECVVEHEEEPARWHEAAGANASSPDDRHEGCPAPPAA